jgi:CRP/FNR family transcriptional regulator
VDTAADGSAINPASLKRACSTCSLNELCWHPSLSSLDLERLNDIVRVADNLPAGGHLFQVGDKFTAIYAVRSGCVKTYSVDANGVEHVHGFHAKGDLLGFDAVFPERHRCSAAIIQNCSVCVLPYEDFQEFAAMLPSLQATVMQLISRAFSDHLSIPATAQAEQRLCAFLLEMGRRQDKQGMNPYELDLPMSRVEIASFLGFTVETGSRLLSRMQKEGLIKVRRRHIYLIDIDGLTQISTHGLQ